MDEFPASPSSVAAEGGSQLMGIGHFSALSRLSVRMLRHYDSHGVLVPADVDPFTGHRRYAVQQLRDASDIRNLRDVGFGVQAIQTLLAARGTPAWHDALVQQREVLDQELSAARERLGLVDRLLSELQPSPQGDPMSITVERRTIPAMSVVALRGTVPTYSDEGMLWQQMMPAVAEQGITPIGPCGVIEHDEEYTERDVDLSVFLPVAPGTSVRAPLELVELPERDCMVAHVVGPYDQLTSAHDQINERIAAEGLSFGADGTVAGKPFNIYLTTPDQAAPADLVTDVCEPLG